MAQGARVPKFGGWGNEEEAPNYTVYFNKAREDKGSGGKMINPNDPQENPAMFPKSTGRTRTEPAADRNQSPHLRHGGRGRDSVKDSGGRPGRLSTGSADHSVEKSPIHPQHQKVMERGGASPGWEGKNNSHDSSHGGAGKSRMKPANQGNETPDRGAAVPRFGEWENDPVSADSYTGIFQRVRDERNTPGKSPGHVARPSSYSGTPRKPNTNKSSKCPCFPWGRK